MREEKTRRNCRFSHGTISFSKRARRRGGTAAVTDFHDYY